MNYFDSFIVLLLFFFLVSVVSFVLSMIMTDEKLSIIIRHAYKNFLLITVTAIVVSLVALSAGLFL